MKLESKTITISQSANTLFDRLKTPSHIKTLMPDNLENFSFTDNGFSFNLKGMPEISLSLKDTTPYSKITYTASAGKIPFELTFALTQITTEQTSAQVIFEGNLNPVMQMMLKSPIGKLIETMVEHLK